MDKLINDFSISLILWQLFLLVLLIGAVFLLVKVTKKVMRYLDHKTKTVG